MSDYIKDENGNQTIDANLNSLLDYPFNWTAYLAEPADTISTYEFTVVGAGATKKSEERVGNILYAWIEVLVPGAVVEVRCSIVTGLGRKDSQTVFINVKP